MVEKKLSLSSQASQQSQRKHSIKEHAVGGLGLIETGLYHQESAATTHTANTSSSKPGRCIIRKYTVRRKEQVLLYPMKLTIPSGSLTAIIGPSSCGKTSLLKFLAECTDPSTIAEGEVNIPGTKSYVHDEANLFGHYTPRTYLKHYDRLTTGRRNGCKSDEEIENILKSLGILEHRRNCIVGDQFRRGLTLSEIRRLNLGLMMLGAPDTIFIEEPLLSLDSETSLEVMEFLKGYSFQPGRRAIITISKPSSVVWNLIDNVILISQGRLIYEGSRFDMESFFAFNKCPTPRRYSPVEHYLSMVSSVKVEKTMDQWCASFDNWQSQIELNNGSDMLAEDMEVGFPATQVATVIINPVNESNRNICHVLWVFIELSRRYFLNLIFNVGFLWLRLFMFFVFSMFIALLFRYVGALTTTTSILSKTSLMFFLLSFFTLVQVAVIPTRFSDKLIVKKEEFNGYYHPILHHFANTLASVLAVIILTFTLTIIYAPIDKINQPYQFSNIMFLSLQCAEALTQMTTLIVPNYIYGMAIYVGLLGFFIPLMGFMVIPSEFPSWLRWAHKVPFYTYAWRSLMVSEFTVDDKFDSLEFPTGEDVLKAYEINDTDYHADIATLFFYGIFIHLICVIIICVKHKYFVRGLRKGMKSHWTKSE